MYSRDRARFHAADKDGDGGLTLIEYVNFKNPLKSEGKFDKVSKRFSLGGYFFKCGLDFLF